MRVADEFPSTVTLEVNREHRKDKRLTDSLVNLDQMIVASSRLVALLQELAVPELEYLPVPVLDHAGQLTTDPYAIVNLLNPIDCLDVEASGARYSRIDTEAIDRVKRLVIDESRIDPTRVLFRPRSYSAVILAHRSLAARIDAAGFNGMRWTELDRWPPT
jgi:hypothetical protein